MIEFSLADKVAVITGGAGAICGAIATTYRQAGAQVAIWDLDHGRAAAVAGQLDTGQAIAVGCDVTDPASIAAALHETRQAFGTVDILVNGAGGSRAQTTTGPDRPFWELVPEDMRQVMDLNYFSAVLPAQALAPLFAERGTGSIVNIASIAGISPVSRAITYSNAKAAVANYTQWLAVHFAREYSPGIRVNAIAPGFILTDQNRFLLVDQATGQPTERGRQIIQQCPMGRYGRPEEIAGAALWLASDQASFVTGSMIVIDGGFTACCGV